MKQVEALGDRALVEKIEITKSAGGIYIPPTEKHDRQTPIKGKVVSVGEGEHIKAMNLKPGEVVLIQSNFNYDMLKDGESTYLFVGHSQILGHEPE
ncbi:MAG: co-chaperone GroES family protein [Pseudomonadales bacterium]|nr:co-chaperone GroES family protein [Pseudomonadales bacterium]